MPDSSLTDASALLVRNIEHFRQQRVLLVNGPGDKLPKELTGVDAIVKNLSYHFGHHQAYRCQHSVDESCFAPLPPEEWQNLDTIILYWPKEKSLALLFIEQLLHRLAPDGLIYLVGENKGGIKSATNALKKVGLKTQKVDSARHCTLLCVSAPEGLKQINAPLSNWQSEIELSIANQKVTLAALPGVFSSGRLDEGTQLLLENVPQQLGERILDFGCGCGVISTTLAKADSSRQLTAVDVSAYALYATEQTLALNGVSGTVKAVSGIETLQGEQFDAIVTNPPFHQGISTHYTVTEQLIEQAPNLLKKGGKLILVANKFLKYPPLLEKAFGAVEILASTSKFVVYQCVK